MRRRQGCKSSHSFYYELIADLAGTAVETIVVAAAAAAAAAATLVSADCGFDGASPSAFVADGL